MTTAEDSPGIGALAVEMRPTRNALGRLISVLQTRGAEILQLTWMAPPIADDDGLARAAVLVLLDAERLPYLCRAIARLVDVMDVHELPISDLSTTTAE